MGTAGVALVPIAYFIVLPIVSDRGPVRIETFLRMVQGKEVDELGVAYDAYHCSVAVGKAGWTGTGWMADANRSLHAKGFIANDTAHTDYIFAVIAEEQGFRGSLLLLSSFALMLVLCLFIGAYARDPMGRLLVGGAVAIFFAHIFENIGMNVLLMPITGIPLPLISYSGTFVVICMFLLGLVQSVWIHRDAIRVVEDAPKPAPVVIGPARAMR